MSEEERDRIMKEHEKQMVKIENRSVKFKYNYLNVDIVNFVLVYIKQNLVDLS